MTAPSQDDFGAYGLRGEDEDVHPFDPADPTWNESWFHDWTSPDGTEAGHCRVGWMPTRGRVWVWLFLRRGDSWFGLEASRVDDRRFDPSVWRLDAGGLLVERTVQAALRRSRLHVRTQVRGLHGPDQGRVLPVELSLDLVAAGPPHSTGENVLDDVQGEPLTANRFEQPVRVHGTVTLDGACVLLDGFGERDHSWGPRDWRMQWTFLVLHGPERALQAAFVELDPAMRFSMGYLRDEAGMRDLVEVDFDLEERPDDPMHAAAGRVRLVDEAGRTLAGTLTPLGGAEIDLGHVLKPTWRARYHRVQVRFVPDEGAPLLGWLELNRFPAGLQSVLDDDEPIS